MSAIMVCSEDSSEKERGWTIIATKILCLSLIGVIHFQGRFWDIKLQMNCLTLSWIRSMHLNFQKVCNFLLQFRVKYFLIFCTKKPVGIYLTVNLHWFFCSRLVLSQPRLLYPMHFYISENWSLPTPQRGQTHSSGTSSQAVPAATPLSGSPTSGSYT